LSGTQATCGDHPNNSDQTCTSRGIVKDPRPSGLDTPPRSIHVVKGSRSLHNSQSHLQRNLPVPVSCPPHRQRPTSIRKLLTPGSPWNLTNNDPYMSPAAGPLFAGLLLFTLTTLIVVAWYIGYNIDRDTHAGVVVGLAMAAFLLIAAIRPYWDEYRRAAHCLQTIKPYQPTQWYGSKVQSTSSSQGYGTMSSVPWYYTMALW
jgi:hypothetical protein